MTYAVFEDEHYYICHDGRELRYIRTESKEQDGYNQAAEVYSCGGAAAGVSINPNVFTDTMRKRIRTE